MFYFVPLRWVFLHLNSSMIISNYIIVWIKLNKMNQIFNQFFKKFWMDKWKWWFICLDVQLFSCPIWILVHSKYKFKIFRCRSRASKKSTCIYAKITIVSKKIEVVKLHFFPVCNWQIAKKRMQFAIFLIAFFFPQNVGQILSFLSKDEKAVPYIFAKLLMPKMWTKNTR